MTNRIGKCKECKREPQGLTTGLCCACYWRKRRRASPKLREQQSAITKKWQKKNPQYFREYYRTHKEYWQNYWKKVG